MNQLLGFLISTEVFIDQPTEWRKNFSLMIGNHNKHWAIFSPILY